MNTSYVRIRIDLSKDELELAYHGQRNTPRFANNPPGFAALIEQVSPHQPRHLVVEATGGYQRRLAEALHQAELPIATINPRLMRDLAKSWNYLAKNDRIDARIIAQSAHEREPRLDQKPDENRQKRADLGNRRQQMIKQRTAETNRLQQAIDQDVAQSIQSMIDMLDEQIAKIDKQIQNAIELDPQANQQHQILTSVKGVGEKTANTLLSDLPELGHCSRHDSMHEKTPQLPQPPARSTPNHQKSGKHHLTNHTVAEPFPKGLIGRFDPWLPAASVNTIGQFE